MTRTEFENAAKAQNAARAAEVVAARATASPCDVVTMFAFGGVDYCRAHRVMGPCPYAKARDLGPAATGNADGKGGERILERADGSRFRYIPAETGGAS